MSDLKVKPDLVQSFITNIESDGQSVVIWAQNDLKSVVKFESLMDANYQQLFSLYYKPIRDNQLPQIKKYYIFCDKSNYNFYRVYVLSFDPKNNKCNVLFIDFGYEEVVPTDCLLVYEKLFFDCKPLAQKFVLADIRPKDSINGWNPLDVVQSLEKYLRSVFMFTIFEQSDNRYVSVFDTKGQQIMIQTLSAQFSDSIIFAPNDANNHLIAIEYNVSTNDLDFNSFDEQNIDFPTNSQLSNISTNNIVITEDLLGLEDNTYQRNESMIGQTSQSFIKEDKTVCESNSLIDSLIMSDSTVEPKTEFIDKTDSTIVTNHLRSLFGPKRKAYIIKTVSERSIYCHLTEDMEMIDKLTEDMNEFYNKTMDCNEHTLTLEDMTIDLVIAAMFTDQSWYRASVKAVNSAKAKVRVFYIDFGNTEIIDVKLCKQLVQQFRALPPQAIHCNVINECLGADTLEMYETSQIEIECKFLSLTGHTLDVELYDEKGVLIDILNESSKSEKKVSFDSKVSEDIIESQNLKTIEKNEESSGQLCVDNIEVDDNIVKHFKQLIGQTKSVLISNAVSAQSIYCQLSESSNKLEALIKDMTTFYNKTHDICNTDGIEAELRSGKGLIAVFSHLEEKWFRAKVCTNKDRETVEVFYIDSGNEDIVPLDYCRQLSETFARMPPFAIHCLPLNDITYYVLKKLECNENPIDLTFIKLNEKTLVFDVQFED